MATRDKWWLDTPLPKSIQNKLRKVTRKTPPEPITEVVPPPLDGKSHSTGEVLSIAKHLYNQKIEYKRAQRSYKRKGLLPKPSIEEDALRDLKNIVDPEE